MLVNSGIYSHPCGFFNTLIFIGDVILSRGQYLFHPQGFPFIVAITIETVNLSNSERFIFTYFILQKQLFHKRTPTEADSKAKNC